MWPECSWQAVKALGLVAVAGSLLLCLVDQRHVLYDPGKVDLLLRVTLSLGSLQWPVKLSFNNYSRH